MKTQLLSLLFLATLLTSCDEKKQTIKIEDKYSVEVPSSFSKATGLNEDASLEYQDLLKQLYVIVIDEQKSEFSRILDESELTEIYAADLAGYSKLIIDGIDPSVSLDSLPDFVDGTVNGLKSRQVDMEGVTNKSNIYWKFAFIEGKNSYYQVMVWTLAENRRKYDGRMQEIINSFRETDRSKKQ